MNTTRRARLPLFLMFLAAACMLLPATVLAQGGPRHGGGPGHFTNPRHLVQHADKLELTENQQEKIRQLLEENRGEIHPLRETLRQEGETLREMMADDAVDRQQVFEQLDQVLDLEAQVKRKRTAMVLDVRDILDVDQRAQARELFEEKGQRMRNRGKERRQHRQQRQQRRGK